MHSLTALAIGLATLPNLAMAEPFSLADERITFTATSGSFSFDNIGQSFISQTHYDNMTSLTVWSHDKLAFAVQDSAPIVRYGLLGAHLLANIRLQFGNAYVLHEYSHIEIDHYYNHTNTFVGAMDPFFNVPAENPYLSNMLTMAFGMAPWDFTSRLVGNTTDGGPLTPEEDVLSYSAGLNFNTFLAEESFHNMVRHAAPVPEGIGYLTNKAFSPVYFWADNSIGGDPSDYVDMLGVYGINIDKSDIQALNIGAMLLSNGFLTSVRGLPGYFRAGEHLKPISFDTHVAGQKIQVYWPEFSVYMNATGVSLRGEVLAHLNNGSLIGVALERNVLGDAAGIEVTLSYEADLERFHPDISLSYNSNGGVFANIGLGYDLSSHYRLLARAYGGGQNTLRGARLMPGGKFGGYIGMQARF